MNIADMTSLVRSGNFSIIAGDPIVRANNSGVYTVALALDDGWYDFFYADGVWEGIAENAYIIPRMDATAAMYYGRMFRQTCVIAQNAMYYTDGSGKVVPLDCATTIFASEPLGDCYTSVQCDDGTLYFCIPELLCSTPQERIAALKDRRAISVR